MNLHSKEQANLGHEESPFERAGELRKSKNSGSSSLSGQTINTLKTQA
jgi:hypothetical protein